MFLFDFVLYSIPEDVTRTSVILDGSTYQRLSQAARSRPKLIREQEIVESKRNRDAIEVDRLFFVQMKNLFLF